MRGHGRAGEFATNRLKFYGAAFRELNVPEKQSTSRWMNIRTENPYRPFRRR